MAPDEHEVCITFESFYRGVQPAQAVELPRTVEVRRDEEQNRLGKGKVSRGKGGIATLCQFAPVRIRYDLQHRPCLSQRDAAAVLAVHPNNIQHLVKIGRLSKARDASNHVSLIPVAQVLAHKPDRLMQARMTAIHAQLRAKRAAQVSV